MSGQIHCHGSTHIGNVRKDNQDQFLIADLNKSMRVYQTSLGLDHHTRLFGASQGKLLLVADGMGGHASGERASALAVDSIATYLLNTMPWFFRLNSQSDNEFQEDLQEALRHCQKTLAAEVRAVPQQRGMGTTVTLAYIHWPRLYVVHAGDSRCYLFHEGKLQRLTRDHTLSQFYSDLQQELGESEQPDPAWSNVLWNVVGGDTDELTIDFSRSDLEIGDALLLCTDGLSKHIGDERFAAALGSKDSPAAICRQLTDEANAAGGTDNITLVVARFQEAPPVEEDADVITDLTEDERQWFKSADTDPFLPAVAGHWHGTTR
jgi:protein phosphatase